MRIYLGDKFYKYDEREDKVYTIRICKIKNENSFTYKDENGNKHSISKNNLLNEYIRLKPDGILAFTIANLENNLKDIIVALYRTKDLNDGNTLPYCVCRQNIFDMFTNQIQKNNKMYVGVSVSIDTIPEDTPFEMVLACNGVDYVNHVSVYLDDLLDEILSFVNTDKFDLLLKTMYNNVTNNEVQGYSQSLKQLLVENDFMYDFLRAFNIYRVDYNIFYDLNTFELDNKQRIVIEEMLKVEMFRTYVIEYDKEINLNKIQREHIIVSDKSGKIYIIAYDKGEYINRTYVKNIKDKRDAVAMLRYKKINK